MKTDKINAFRIWFDSESALYGQLMTQKVTSLYIGITPQYLAKLVKKGILHTHTWKNQKFIGKNDATGEIIRRQNKADKITLSVESIPILEKENKA